MKYISLRSSRSAIPTGPSATRLEVRGIRNSQSINYTNVDEAVDCRLSKSELISVPNSQVRLLRTGFSIDLISEIRLRWVRFRLAFDSRNVEVLSIFPKCILMPEHYEGRIAVGNNGELFWAPVTPGRAEQNAATYTPNIVGNMNGTAVAFWDFFPWDEGTPRGSNHLVVALQMSGLSQLQITARIFMRVNSVNADDIHLELPAESIGINPLVST